MCSTGDFYTKVAYYHGNRLPFGFPCMRAANNHKQQQQQQHTVRRHISTLFLSSLSLRLRLYPMTQPLNDTDTTDPRRLISRIAAGETNLCGRDEELAKLNDIVKMAMEEEQNHVIAVPGVSGAGKSKVVDTFGSSVVQDGNVLFCTGKCDSTMTNKPFTVVKNALSEMAVTILAGNNEDDIRKTDALRRTDPRLSQCVSWY